MVHTAVVSTHAVYTTRSLYHAFLFVQVPKTYFVLHIWRLSSAARRSFLALPVAEHADAPHFNYGTHLGLSRAPWRLLWAPKVARATSCSRKLSFARRAEQGHGNPKIASSLFCSAAVFAVPRHPQKRCCLRQPRYTSSHASRFSLDVMHERCFRVSACVCHPTIWAD